MALSKDEQLFIEHMQSATSFDRLYTSSAQQLWALGTDALMLHIKKPNEKRTTYVTDFCLFSKYHFP